MRTSLAAGALALCVAGLLSPGEVWSAARTPVCPAAGTEAVVFGHVSSGSSFHTDTGIEIRLVGILAPGEGGEAVSPAAAEAARQVLERALKGGALSLAGDASTDRYGRRQAYVFADGEWVQAAMVRAGLVRAAPDRQSEACAGRLLAAEGDARAARVGHWRDGFVLRTPDQIRGRAGMFEIVEGTVVGANLVRGRAFINFGADYRTDFTITVAPPDMRSFRQAKVDVSSLAGKHVRVRGWVELYNGPEMQLTTPAAIEILD